MFFYFLRKSLIVEDIYRIVFTFALKEIKISKSFTDVRSWCIIVPSQLPNRARKVMETSPGLNSLGEEIGLKTKRCMYKKRIAWTNRNRTNNDNTFSPCHEANKMEERYFSWSGINKEFSHNPGSDRRLVNILKPQKMIQQSEWNPIEVLGRRKETEWSLPLFFVLRENAMISQKSFNRSVLIGQISFLACWFHSF